ncbi:hypothetical protein Lfu02_12830 [Longispora fulva]|uniref:SGNH hydrolase-type esterase domain-containing protein n=1 Tax=Longispora fulva TaxID=619741 RepID=A0A8J7GE56_9ACTN|nr:SGNH/GDSL hydrolase family protein [Longispora fulva]MBG6134857.1 hypothetical protein [Longispora fulva]GIG56911.1 hypothetical protein Lfu02_12830 [Longispora fulva]
MFYAALGDSMSIDDYSGGPGHGAASLLYRNRDADFPAWAGRDLATRHPGIGFVPLARDGATSADLLAYQLPNLPGGDLALARVTIGGNDLLRRYGDSAAARAELDDVTGRTHAVLAALRARLGDGPLLVGTVYDPSDGTGEVPGSGLDPWPGGPAVIGEYNTALAGVAAAHGATVVDLRAAFHGHGVTAGDPSGPEPRPADPALWYCGVVEPNAFGAHAIRSAWWRSLGVSPDAG